MVGPADYSRPLQGKENINVEGGPGKKRKLGSSEIPPVQDSRVTRRTTLARSDANVTLAPSNVNNEVR